MGRLADEEIMAHVTDLINSLLVLVELDGKDNDIHSKQDNGNQKEKKKLS